MNHSNQNSVVLTSLYSTFSYGITQEGRCRTFILRIVTHLPCRLLNVVFTYLFVDCMTGL